MPGWKFLLDGDDAYMRAAGVRPAKKLGAGDYTTADGSLRITKLYGAYRWQVRKMPNAPTPNPAVQTMIDRDEDQCLTTRTETQLELAIALLPGWSPPAAS